MIELDYVIPLANLNDGSQEDRIKDLQYVIDKYLLLQRDIKLRLVLIEQRLDINYPLIIDNITLPSRLNCTVKVVNHPIFCKPWLYNLGAKLVQSDTFAIAEAECFAVNQTHLRDSVWWLKKKQVGWCFAWNKITYLSSKSRQRLFDNGILEPEPHPQCNPLTKVPEPGKAEGGIVLFRTKFWQDKLRGADECYTFLGGNDNELAFRAHKVSGEYRLFPGQIYHLWHKISSIKFGNTKKINSERFKQLRQGDNYKIVQNVLLQHELGNDNAPKRYTYVF